MRFVQIINNNRFTLISIFLFLYVMLNLLDGNRGLISYYEKKETMKNLLIEEKLLVMKLAFIEKKNKLLTDEPDIDYLETLYRKKFLMGKAGEKIFISD